MSTTSLGRTEVLPALPARREARGGAATLTIAGPALLVAAILAGWQAVTASRLVSPLLLPSPAAIVEAGLREAPTLLVNAAYTGAEALSGFALGNGVGVLLALAFVHSAVGRRAVLPLATAAQAVPVVAVVPALILWFGNGMAPKVFVAAFLAFFPMLVNASRGLRSASAEVNDLLYTLSASPGQVMRLVRLPASTRYLFNALRASACSCVIAALVAEWVAADRGLGYLIVLWSARYQMAEVWAAVICGTALSMAVYGLVTLGERRATPWTPRDNRHPR